VLEATPVTVPTGNATLGAPARRNDSCASLNDQVLALLRANRSITTVALAGAWDFWSSGVDIGTGERRYLAARDSDDLGVDESRRVLRAGLERTVRELRGLGLQVLLLGQVPDYARSPSECLARSRAAGEDAEDCRGPRGAALARSQWSRELLQELAAAHGATVFDPHAQLCAPATCLVEAGGRQLYRDSDHLSADGSAFLGAALPERLFHNAALPVTGGSE
jgi:hypothetical protein